MEKFIMDNLELIVGAVGVVAVSAFLVTKIRKPAKNYFDVSDLTREYKKRQQALNPKNKLF